MHTHTDHKSLLWFRKNINNILSLIEIFIKIEKAISAPFSKVKL